MAATPPGWYRDEEQSMMRWWDGSNWSDPSRDSRLLPGEPTVIDSAALTFVADPAWPTPPTGWYPTPTWEPEPAWPKPVDNLWRAVGVDDEALLVDLAGVLTILVEEEAQTEDCWRLDSLDSIPLVWVAPPNWPRTGPGWSPPDRWKAPRRWGRAPKNWQFWQQDPTVINYKTAAIHAKADERSRALVRSTVGVAKLLSQCESLLCDVVRLTPLALSPLPSAARNGFPITAPSHLVESLKAAHETLHERVSNLRTYLLRLAYGIGQPDEWLWQLRRDLIDAQETYQLAAKAAAEGVFSDTIEHTNREASRLKPRQAKRRERLMAVLAELATDVEARARALSPQELNPTDDSEVPIDGTSSWESAESLASEHLRRLGFTDALRTPVGSDGGFDVEGRGVVAQVKYRATAVGRPDVQRLVGANQHGAQPVFYARAGYSQNAIDYAGQAGVALFVLDAITSQVDPVNEAATRLCSNAQ